MSKMKKAKIKNQEKLDENKGLMYQREKNLMSWVTYWRANPHRFAEDYLGINLKFFQKILLFLMFKTPSLVLIAPRGIGKSWLTAVYAVTRAILYPNSKILIASGVKNQSRLIISEKIVGLYNDHEAIREEIGGSKSINTSVNNAHVKFKNGSKIESVVAGDNARGYRANCLIVDEFRLVEYETVSEVLKPFLNVPREPRFKSKYPAKYADYNEENIEIYISSAWYKSNWSWNQFKDNVSKMIKYSHKRAIGLSLSYQLSVVHDLLPIKTVEDQLTSDNFDKASFAMEYEGQFMGENENAFFEYEPLQRQMVVDNTLDPPTPYEYVANKNLSKPVKNLGGIKKQSDEIRLVSMDVALMGSSRIKNDTAVIFALRLLPDGENGYKRQVVYIESVRESITDRDLATKFKRLYYDFDADYAVLDAMGNGLGVYDRCAEVLYDSERDEEYPPWKSINDPSMAERAPKSALPNIYTIKASASLNSEIATGLKSAVLSRKIELPTSYILKREELVEKTNFKTLSVEEQHRKLRVHQESTALVNELISLEYIVQGGNIKIVEPYGGTKDRYSALAYANYIANEIEIERKTKSDYDDLDEFAFVGGFMF